MEHNKLKSKYRLVEYRVGNQLDKQLRWRKQYQSRFQSLQQSTWLQGRRRACTLVALSGSSEAPVWEQTCKISSPSSTSSWSSIPRWCSNHYHHQHPCPQNMIMTSNFFFDLILTACTACSVEWVEGFCRFEACDIKYINEVHLIKLVENIIKLIILKRYKR